MDSGTFVKWSLRKKSNVHILLWASKKRHQREHVINYKVANEGKSRQTLQAWPLMGSTGQTQKVLCTELLKAIKKTTNKGREIRRKWTRSPLKGTTWEEPLKVAHDDRHTCLRFRREQQKLWQAQMQAEMESL